MAMDRLSNPLGLQQRRHWTPTRCSVCIFEVDHHRNDGGQHTLRLLCTLLYFFLLFVIVHEFSLRWDAAASNYMYDINNCLTRYC